MDKILRRATLARAQAKRRARKVADAKRFDEEWQRRRETVAKNREQKKAVVAARHDRREDWLLGPLAPKRDAGALKDSYGSISQRAMYQRKLFKDEKSEYINIVEGDRVVVVEGREKGKIGKVKKVDKDSEDVTVEGLNLVSFESFALVFERNAHQASSVRLLRLHRLQK